MTLLNDPASVPAPMWAVTRALLFLGKPVQIQDAKALMSPVSLFGDATAAEKDTTFEWAYKTLANYGTLTVIDNTLTLAPAAQALRVEDYSLFVDFLRGAILTDERNSGLADNPDLRGPRDLTRALAWFLARDPFGPALNWDEASDEQSLRPFPAQPNVKPFSSSFRWDRFVYWSIGLGFAEPSVLGNDGRASRIIPDCTAAVGRTIRQLWPAKSRILGHEAEAALLRALPVLPGGAYSRELGIPGHDTLSPALSFALLSAAGRGWVDLRQHDDAPRDIVLIDPDTAAGRRRVTELVVLEEIDA
ncbi:hypothetical protein [Micromonospora rubida]|uniref:hypothetical protein n=1 Tax=Micromonospora rubida TaxID=2697657 RepID=UPI00137709B2|nr:hypothetical protein [Micromonospora rubida]NBE85421.1 hypothetical protein [Micromonospora rubida]